MSMKTVTQTLASAVATSGTFTVTYPSGTNAAWFQKGVQHQISALGGTFTTPEDFGITTFGNTTCTITWRHSVTLPAGTVVKVGLDVPGGRWLDKPPVFTDMTPNNISELKGFRIQLGAPIVADVDAVATSLPTSGAVTLAGAAVSGGVATLDVPRNITVTPIALCTFNGVVITGKDLYENTLIENITTVSINGTVQQGVKAFKSVSAITLIATTGLTNSTGTIGFGDVLGLPVFLPSSGFVVRELQDGATASAGTVVAGLDVNTVSTATTADVRGTYDPNAATDGSRAFELLVLLSDPNFKGVPQYDG